MTADKNITMVVPPEGVTVSAQHERNTRWAVAQAWDSVSGKCFLKKATIRFVSAGSVSYIGPAVTFYFKVPGSKEEEVEYRWFNYFDSKKDPQKLAGKVLSKWLIGQVKGRSSIDSAVRLACTEQLRQAKDDRDWMSIYYPDLKEPEQATILFPFDGIMKEIVLFKTGQFMGIEQLSAVYGKLDLQPAHADLLKSLLQQYPEMFKQKPVVSQWYANTNHEYIMSMIWKLRGSDELQSVFNEIMSKSHLFKDKWHPDYWFAGVKK